MELESSNGKSSERRLRPSRHGIQCDHWRVCLSPNRSKRYPFDSSGVAHGVGKLSRSGTVKRGLPKLRTRSEKDILQAAKGSSISSSSVACCRQSRGPVTLGNIANMTAPTSSHEFVIMPVQGWIHNQIATTAQPTGQDKEDEGNVLALWFMGCFLIRERK